jgi:prepilin-type N-terminal cleavage/methylation domain-containing protein
MNSSLNTTPASSSTDTGDKGFTLVEILIAIVLVGILSVVVIVGISNLTSSGSKSACTASLDSAKAGSVAYYASSSPNRYPANFTELTPASNPALVLPSGAKVNTTVLSTTTTPAALDNAAVGMAVVGPSWQLTMTAGASTAVTPTFACTNA